jgi:tetratricopeptide (TPR) repeat protein
MPNARGASAQVIESPASHAAEPGRCTRCGSPAEPGYAASLCIACRTTLVNRPFPIGIRLGAVLLVVTVVTVAVTSSRGSYEATVALNRGKALEKSGDLALAQVEYQQVVRSFPESVEALVRLGTVLFKNGKKQEGIEIAAQLRGRSIPKELETDAEKIENSAVYYGAQRLGETLQQQSKPFDPPTTQR